METSFPQLLVEFEARTEECSNMGAVKMEMDLATERIPAVKSEPEPSGGETLFSVVNVKMESTFPELPVSSIGDVKVEEDLAAEHIPTVKLEPGSPGENDLYTAIDISLPDIKQEFEEHSRKADHRAVSAETAMEQHQENDSSAPPLTDMTSKSLNEPEKEFILMFETLPELWNKTHQHYTNKYKRNDALNKLLVIYKNIKHDAKLDDVRKKINSLRSNYRREFKKIISSKRSGAGVDEVYSPKSWTFEFLQFLYKFEQPQVLDTDGDIQENNVPCGSKEERQEAEENEAQLHVTSMSSVNQIAIPQPRSSKVKKKATAKQNELLERACEFLSQSTPPPVSNPIALEWAATLDRLDDKQRIYAKKAISDILFEAELGNLDRHSVQINVRTPIFSPPSCYRHNLVQTPPSVSYQHNSVHSPPSVSYQHNSVQSPPSVSYQHNSVHSPPSVSYQHNSVQSPPSVSYQHNSVHSPPSVSYQHNSVQSPPSVSYQHNSVQSNSVFSPPQSPPPDPYSDIILVPTLQPSVTNLQPQDTASAYTHSPGIHMGIPL